MKRALRGVLLGLVLLAIMLPGIGMARAQSPAATLVGRAIMAAASFADGPKCGVALGSKPINGIAVPFYSQPVGSFSSIIRGGYNGTWLLLSDKTSPDCLLRAYIVDVDWRRASTGSGAINLLDWITLSDPRNAIKTPVIKNANVKGRQLVGADFDPRSVSRASDGTFWIAEATLPSLLHVTSDGIVLQVFPLAGGVLQGMSMTPNGKALLIALKGSSGIEFHLFDTASGSLAGAATAYPLDAPADTIGDVTVINDHQALVVEQDNQQGAAAKIKRVYLADFKNDEPKKLLIDLLNIADPSNIGTSTVFGSAAGAFGLKPFSFPFLDVSGVYPLDASTLIIVNNNHLPNATGRTPNVAENTELIAVKLASPLDVQLKDAQE